MRVLLSLFLAATAVSVLAGAAEAHMGAKGIVKDRMEVMKSFGAAMKSISRMARGKEAVDTARVAGVAKKIGDHSATLVGLFPAGSHGGVSQASPEIWANPAGFRKSAESMTRAAGQLLSAAQSGDAPMIKSAFRALGRTCSACHADFRIKRKH